MRLFTPVDYREPTVPPTLGVGKTRLVMPRVAAGGFRKDDDHKPGGGGGGGGAGGGVDDPLISALIQKLPKGGSRSVAERVNWLKLLTMAFQIAYGQEETIEIKKETAS